MWMQMYNSFPKFVAAVALSAAAMPASAANVPDKKPHIQVGIILFDGVEIIDFAGPYEVFGQAGFGVVTLSRDGKPVTTEMGLKVTPDHAFANAPAIDLLLVPGGEVSDAMKDPELLRFVRERSAAATNVLSVCTGSHILAASGILDGLQATTFHLRLDGFEKKFPKVKVVRDVRWTDNGKIITSAGLSSGMDAAFHVLARLRGVDAARTAALVLEYDWKPEGGFVRTLMADRYFPEIKADAKWPADLKTEQLSALGNTMHWRQSIEVSTATAPEALLKVLAGSVEAAGGWQRVDPAKGYVWQRAAEGKQVRFTLSTTARSGALAAYELEMKVEVL